MMDFVAEYEKLKQEAQFDSVPNHVIVAHCDAALKQVREENNAITSSPETENLKRYSEILGAGAKILIPIIVLVRP